MLPREALARAILAGTDEQAADAYNALAQWADNTRNGLEETYDDPESEGAKELAQVASVDALVDAYEVALDKLAAPHDRGEAARNA